MKQHSYKELYSINYHIIDLNKQNHQDLAIVFEYPEVNSICLDWKQSLSLYVEIHQKENYKWKTNTE